MLLAALCLTFSLAAAPAALAAGVAPGEKPSSAWLPSEQLTSVAPHAGVSSSQTDFGSAVAIDGETAAVGYPSEQSVYIYERDETGWSAPVVFSGPPGFGEAVAISDGRMVVGAPASSSVSVFERASGAWTGSAVLTGPVAGCLGSAVAVDGDALVAGDPCATETAYVFQPHLDGWSLTAELTNQGNRLFSRTLAIDGDTLLVGGVSLWAYKQVAGGWGEPIQVSSVSGAAVGLSGDLATTGSAGKALIFERDADGGSWSQTAALEPVDASPFTLTDDRFGWTLDLADGVLVAGAWKDDHTPGAVGPDEVGGRPCVSAVVGSACFLPQPGSVYVYEPDPETGAWIQTAKLSGEAASGERFGFSVAVDSAGTTILVGAPGHPAELGGFVDIEDSVHTYTKAPLEVGP